MRWTIFARLSAFTLYVPILGSGLVYGSSVRAIDNRTTPHTYDISAYLPSQPVPERHPGILLSTGKAMAAATSSHPAAYLIASLADSSAPDTGFFDGSSGGGSGKASAAVSVGTAVSEAHEKWLANVAEAAASYGCSPKLVQQLPTESIADVLKLFALTATEGTCIVLYPISTDPHTNRYSFASGGKVDGVDIFYLSDVGRTRIWNGHAGAK